MMKKYSLLPAITIIVLMFSCLVSCGSSWDDGTFTYAQTYSKNDKSDATYVVCSVKDNANAVELTIPATYDNKAVSKIDENAFQGCTNLKKVVLPASITDIEPEVFKHCPALEEVVIHAAALEEAKDMFKNAGSADKTIKVTLGAGVTIIPEGMFRDATNLNINFEAGNAVSTIEEEAFKNSSITAVEFTSLERIKSGAFEGCVSLSSISLDCTEGKSLYVEAMDGGAFDGCTNLTSVTIKATDVNLPDSTFDNCVKLSSINFEGSMEQWSFTTNYSTSHIGQDASDLEMSGIFLKVNCNNGVISYHIDGTVNRG